MTFRWKDNPASHPLLPVAAVAMLGAADAFADVFTDCKLSIQRAHADNRESGPSWILIDDKFIVSADPRRAEDVRSWFEEFKAHNPATKNLERYRVVEFDTKPLIDRLRSSRPPTTRSHEFPGSPDFVLAPFVDRLYGMTVLHVSEGLVSGRPTLMAAGVMTNAYGIRGEWQLEIDLSADRAELRVDSTEAVVQSFQPPDSSLVVLGETDRCRLDQDQSAIGGDQ